MNITVYLGASEGKDPELKQAAFELGRWIGSHGHTLIYGGSKMGLMGVLAKSAIEAGGDVIGVEPQMFMDDELQLDGLTELIVTENMTIRKEKMIELGDVFIAFPGGTGTLEEISEVMAKSALGLTDAKCILYNLNHYYDDLRNMLEHMIECGLSTEARQHSIFFLESLGEIAELINK